MIGKHTCAPMRYPHALSSGALEYTAQVTAQVSSSHALSSGALEYTAWLQHGLIDHPSYRLLLSQQAQRGWSTGSSTSSVLQALASSTPTSVSVSVSLRVCLSGPTGSCFLNTHFCKRLCLCARERECVYLPLFPPLSLSLSRALSLALYEALSY